MAAIALPVSSRGGTVHVPAEQPTIQAAIDAAHAGDTVLVAPGEFVITKPINFRGKAIVVRSEKGPDATSVRMGEISKDAEANCVAVFNGGETAEARLEGFTLTGGHGGPPLPQGGSGGGIYCSDSSPTLMNLTISGNLAWSGGGLSCQRGSSPLVLDCRIIGNRAVFIGGGGVFCGEGSSPTLLRCVIAGNYGRHEGGGVFCEGSSPSLVNCLIVENEAKDYGGGIHCESGSSPRLMNCTLEKNRSVGGEDGIVCLGSSLVVTNSIVTSVFADETSSPAISYTLLRLRAAFPGQGNLFGLPLFACDGDYHLRPDSPAVDAGIADGAPASDLDNRERPCGGRIDLGAYEHCLGTTAPVCFLRGNADADGSFDISDAITILGFLFLGGEEPACLDSADANDDGRIDLTDGVSVLGQLFLGDPAPPPPFERCGTDPTPDSLSCDWFGLCL